MRIVVIMKSIYEVVVFLLLALFADHAVDANQVGLVSADKHAGVSPLVETIQKLVAAIMGCPPMVSPNVAINCTKGSKKTLQVMDCAKKVIAGTKATFKCLPGFVTTDRQKTATCQSRKWSKPAITCKEAATTQLTESTTESTTSETSSETTPSSEESTDPTEAALPSDGDSVSTTVDPNAPTTVQTTSNTLPTSSAVTSTAAAISSTATGSSTTSIANSTSQTTTSASGAITTAFGNTTTAVGNTTTAVGKMTTAVEANTTTIAAETKPPTTKATVLAVVSDYVERVTGKYKLYTTPLTWKDAQATCVKDGANLLVFNSDDEVVVALNMGKDKALDLMYVGYTDAAAEGKWMTIHSAGIALPGALKWKTGQPSNGTLKNCAVFSALSRALLDETCAIVSNPFICELNV